MNPINKTTDFVKAFLEKMKDQLKIDYALLFIQRPVLRQSHPILETILNKRNSHLIDTSGNRRSGHLLTQTTHNYQNISLNLFRVNIFHEKHLPNQTLDLLACWQRRLLKEYGYDGGTQWIIDFYLVYESENDRDPELLLFGDMLECDYVGWTLLVVLHDH